MESGGDRSLVEKNPSHTRELGGKERRGHKKKVGRSFGLERAGGKQTKKGGESRKETPIHDVLLRKKKRSAAWFRREEHGDSPEKKNCS